MMILVIEDNDQNRYLMRFLLESYRYSVTVAVDGPSGLEAARRCSPHAILLDIQLPRMNAGEALLISDKHDGPIQLLVTDVVMPRMSGCELAERLVAQRSRMRVLFVSGYNEDLIADHGVLGSGRALVQKPITPDGLLRKIREVLDSP